jgi:hypothetical protein
MKKLVLILLLPLLFACTNDYTNSFNEYLLDSSVGQSSEIADFLNSYVLSDDIQDGSITQDFSDLNLDKSDITIEGKAIFYFENNILSDLEFDNFKYNQIEFDGFDHPLEISDGLIYGFD